MYKFKICLAILLVVLYCSRVIAQLRTNFLIKKYELCQEGNVVKFYGNITTEDGKQYFDSNVTLLYPSDENYGISVMIEQSFNGKTFSHLFTIREKYACKAANKYMGEYWYEIERAAQIPPGVCPVRAGRYHVHHLLMNFNKIALQTFPYGTLRFTFRIIDNRDKKSVFCLLVVAENLLA